jgi:hypothetical protein
MFARGVRAKMQEAGMWAAWIVSAIALAGTAFMVCFLVALLREGPPSVCYWVAPVRQVRDKEVSPSTLRGISFDDDSHLASCPILQPVELLENENYEKEECSTDLIVFDIRRVPDSFSGRSVYTRRGHIFRERGL